MSSEFEPIRPLPTLEQLKSLSREAYGEHADSTEYLFYRSFAPREGFMHLNFRMMPLHFKKLQTI